MSRRRSQPRVSRDEFFHALSPRARLHLLTAIFFTFAAMGVIVCTSRVEIEIKWWDAALWGAFTGAMAIGWALSFMWRMALLPFVVVLQAFGPPMLAISLGEPWELGVRPAAIAGSAIALMVLGYILMSTFLAREGARRLRLQAELDLARQIHETLVPPIALRAGRIEVYGRSDASSEMGGDLLDVVQRAGEIDVYLADVSGHGVRAGVVMGMVKSAIRMRLLSGASIGALLDDLNLVIQQVSEPGMFATFACLRVTPGAMEYALAGHPPILHWRARTGAIDELRNERLPLGVSDSERYAGGAVACETGDLFALFTDGLTETADEDARQFGHERLAAMIASRADQPLEAIHAAIMDAVRAHGRQLDDQTLALVRVR